MKVLFAASEIFPHAKTGGLADVANALPQAMQKNAEVFSVMPLYGFMQIESFKKFHAFTLNLGKIDYKIEVYKKNKDFSTYFIYAPFLSNTEYIYCDEKGNCENNDLRFGLFGAAIVELASFLSVDILHLNDWHTALAALYIREKKLNVKTVLTIHNLVFQGVFEKSSMEKLGLDKKYFTMDILEFYGKINFLKAAIAFSDAITTVSPSYAKEILTHQFGCGLEGFLNHHRKKLTGILNGINTKIFNPSNDKYLSIKYDSVSFEKKYDNKVDFIKKLTLKDPRKPLFVMVSRIVEQKGVDLLLEIIDSVLTLKLNLFILGEGKAEYIEKFKEISLLNDNFDFFNGYSEEFSRKTYAAADFLLMPSKFEPCGLNQMIAMHYGTIPIVHAVGGLNDSVYEEETLNDKSVSCRGRGIVYQNQNKDELLEAIIRAVTLKKNTKKMHSIISFNMSSDFSFDHSVKKYIEIYKKILTL